MGASCRISGNFQDLKKGELRQTATFFAGPLWGAAIRCLLQLLRAPPMLWLICRPFNSFKSRARCPWKPVTARQQTRLWKRWVFVSFAVLWVMQEFSCIPGPWSRLYWWQAGLPGGVCEEADCAFQVLSQVLTMVITLRETQYLSSYEDRIDSNVPEISYAGNVMHSI